MKCRLAESTPALSIVDIIRLYRVYYFCETNKVMVRKTYVQGIMRQA